MKAYRTVLSNAKNLIKAFAPAKIEIEIVCHGEGLDLLFKDAKSMAAMMKVAATSGIQFAACSNTMRGRHIRKDQLYPFAVVVDSGVAEVVRKQEAGWSYLKGAF